MCNGIAKFFKDIIKVFSNIVNIIDSDWIYREKKPCKKVTEYDCLSLADKQLKLLKLEDTFNIGKIIKYISVKDERYKRDERYKTFYKNIDKGFILLNDLYKSKYDFDNGEYIKETYDGKNINEKYKDFIKNIYNTYTIGYAKLLKNNETGLDKKKSDKEIIEFDKWWDNADKSNLFKTLEYNIIIDNDLSYYKKNINTDDEFREKYNRKLKK